LVGRKRVPYRSLRDFLAKIEEEGQLVRIRETVKPEPDIRAAACAAAKMPSGPAVLFERIEGYGKRQVAMNVHGSFQNHALMLDLPKETGPKAQFHELVRRFDRYPVPPRRVSDAQLKEVIIDKNINLYNELPLFRVNPMDGAFTYPRVASSPATRKTPKTRMWACIVSR